MRNILLLLPLLLSLSCAPMVGLQSGRSLGKGNVMITPYAQAGSIYVAKDTSQRISSFLVGTGIQSSIGVTKRLDVGIKLDLTSFIALQAKYQILGSQTSTFAASLGAESGMAFFPWAIADVKFRYYLLPVFISYHPTKRLCFYARPFYSFGQIARPGKTYAIDSSLVDDIITNRRFAFSYGFSIGKKDCFSLEIGHYDAQIYRPTQVAIGYTFKFLKNQGK